MAVVAVVVAVVAPCRPVSCQRMAVVIQEESWGFVGLVLFTSYLLVVFVATYVMCRDGSQQIKRDHHGVNYR
jgi:hypothetical protein